MLRCGPLIDYSPHRWRSHFFDLRGSLVKEIAYRVGVVTLTALFVAIAYHYHEDVAINGTPHALIGGALSLLLVFRTNTANDRYWEGRRLWGSVVNSARNLRRKAEALLPDDPSTTQALVDWTVAFTYAMRAHLVNEKSLGPSSRLSADDQARAIASQHVPVYCAARLTAIIADARRRIALSDIQQQMFDADVQAMVDCLGGCERIEQTPLPFAYAVHLRRILVLYCGTLPFALVAHFGEWTVLVSLLIGYILIGIEEIGTEIEGPFGRRENDLPLDRICDNLQKNLLAPENKP